MNIPAIALKNVHKKYRVGFWGRRFIALDDLSLEIKQGEILGYLGPNGAGKTTTFKVLLDLIRPDKGEVEIFGRPADRKSRGRIGFLPENPYFYMYLTAKESLRFHGQLSGMDKKLREERIPMLLEKVGLDYAANKTLKKFSRGMLQRIGIAQAMINDPDILILDEPMSGLDPSGRSRMRDIILSCRDAGKTVIFSSHILSDVEVMCDRAAMVRGGRLQQVVTVGEMLEQGTQYWEITSSLFEINEELSGAAVHYGSANILFRAETEKEARELMINIEKEGGTIMAFGPHRTSLETLYNKEPV